MDKPVVSIIIPVYNAENYISECIDSVINQTYKKIQVIVVDDGSKDSSGSICDEYAKIDRRIQVIHKGNGGQAKARNLGKSFAEGEYIYYLDSDDYIRYDAVEKMVRAMEGSEADILTFCCKPFGSSNDISGRYHRSVACGIHTGREMFSYCQSHGEFYPTVWLYFFRREAISEKHFIEGIVFEDTPFLFELMSSNVKIAYMNEILVWHRMDDGSTMRSSTTNYKLFSNLVGINKMIAVYQSDPNHTIEQKRFIAWCIGSHYRMLRQLKTCDEETAFYNKQVYEILKANKSFVTWGGLKEFAKTLIKVPRNLKK